MNTTDPVPALEAGRICGVAARGQRDLQRQVARYPSLFTGAGFDPSLLGTVSQANAFSAAGRTADELRALNRTTLWAFALDWRVDYATTDRADLNDLSDRSLAVAAGGEPGDDPLQEFLAQVREDLAEAPAFGELGQVWLDELSRLLAAMTTEWEWKQAVDPPLTVDRYLDNADNLGSSFVNVTHWIATAEPGAGADATAALDATRASQRVLRILNDLATYERDLSWGDLNVLRLPDGEAAAMAALPDLLAQHTDRVGALARRQAGFAEFLDRQVQFCRGFYPVSDYWGQW